MNSETPLNPHRQIPSPKTIRILADDLTGALDTAAVFSGKTPVFIDRAPDSESPYFAAPVSVVATPTRDILSEDIVLFLDPASPWFMAADFSFKKVDSLLRGNTFAEVGWITDVWGFDRAIFAPAFPEQGRITVQCQHYLLRKSDGKNDDKNDSKNGKVKGRDPIAEPLREAFEMQDMLVTQRFPLKAAGGPQVWIPDIATRGELDALVAQYGDNPAALNSLWCGSAGLAIAFARYLGRAADQTQGALHRLDGGPTYFISASYHAVFREQWQLLCAAEKNKALIFEADELGAASTTNTSGNANNVDLTAALGLLGNAPRTAFFSLSPGADALSQKSAEELLHNQVEKLVKGLPRPGQLMVVGGDTLLALCRSTGANALLAEPSGRIGWGCARLIGGNWDGVPCYSRSGAFGTPDDLVSMFQRLQQAD